MSRLLRTLWPLVLVLVFVVGACGTSADDAAAEATSEPPPEVVELIEAYLASWESHDETAIRGLVADGFASTSTGTRPTRASQPRSSSTTSTGL